MGFQEKEINIPCGKGARNIGNLKLTALWGKEDTYCDWTSISSLHEGWGREAEPLSQGFSTWSKIEVWPSLRQVKAGPLLDNISMLYPLYTQVLLGDDPLPPRDSGLWAQPWLVTGPLFTYMLKQARRPFLREPITFQQARKQS